jgi:uncharacterized protein (DUF1800 family)
MPLHCIAGISERKNLNALLALGRKGMNSYSQRLLRIMAAAAFCVAFAVAGLGQNLTDPDPNSPVPVLMTIQGSNRAVALPAERLGAARIKSVTEEAFRPDSRVVLFVRNLSLMPGEGANAFRIYVEHANGRNYTFPVLSIEPYNDPSAGRGIYALTIQLTDQNRFWEAPSADGDVLVAVTWRGLISNKVRLGLGKTGGPIVDPSGSTSMMPDGGTTTAPAPEYVGYRWSSDRKRFLQQATFGPTAALDERIRRIGPRTWLAEQFEAPYPSAGFPYPDFPQKTADAGSATGGCGMFTGQEQQVCVRDHYSMYQPQTWFMREAFYGDAQLRHRVAWALNQIWVTAFPEVQQNRHMIEYHKVLSKNAFGNFRDLMGPRVFDVPTSTAGLNTCSSCGITLNPAMGQYLDMAISTRNNPNENYARELMQLFSVGLFMLNQDGTYQTDGQGNLIPTYDQNVVNDLTKVLTGWTLCNNAANCPNIVSGAPNYIDPMLLNTNNHDLTAKTLLSYPGSTTTNVPACPAPCTTVAQRAAYANASMIQALDNIFNHPNVGPFISRILIQHMVTSSPSPAYVSRVAGVFNNNGFGTRGDMKAVVKAILLDPEARGDVKTDPNYGKLREPMQLMTNFARAFNVKSADGLGLSDGNFIRGRTEFVNMGQVPFMSPTVFNFYPPDYVIPGTSLNGPEFAIMNTGTSIARANFFNRMVFTAPAFAVQLPDTPNGTSFDFNDLQALVVADPTNNLLLDELNNRMLHGQMSAQMRSTLQTAINAITVSSPPTATQARDRVRQAVYLIATSSQFQVQR